MLQTVLLCVLLFACTPGKYMTYDGYDQVVMGESIANVQVLVGRPYEIKELSPTKKEYIYIERISIGDDRELFRRYILTVENGKVINKQVKEESTPPVQFFGQ